MNEPAFNVVLQMSSGNNISVLTNRDSALKFTEELASQAHNGKGKLVSCRGFCDSHDQEPLLIFVRPDDVSAFSVFGDLA